MPYSPDQRRRILDIARIAARCSLTDTAKPHIDILAEEQYLTDPRGCFVTLHDLHRRLRGCIGTFDSQSPLHENLIQVAAAVTRDPRFIHTQPVTIEELHRLHIEVSVLSPMQRIDDPRTLRIGIDGIHIRTTSKPRVSGCFLPQVALEHNWSVEKLLEQCCQNKMFLPPDAWRTNRDIEFYIFQSEIIDESDHPQR